MDVPWTLRLALDSDKVLRRVGGKVATRVRRLLRAGKDHGPTHVPRDGRPFWNTGEMVRSIKYQGEMVSPEWSRYRADRAHFTVYTDNYGDSGARGRRVQTSYAVMVVNMAAGRWTDPMHETDPALWGLVETETQRAIDKEMASGRNLSTQLRRVRVQAARQALRGSKAVVRLRK